MSDEPNILQFDVIILCLSWIKTRFRQYCLPYDSSQLYDVKEFTDVLRAMESAQVRRRWQGGSCHSEGQAHAEWHGSRLTAEEGHNP